MTNRSRIEGMLSALREEWTDTQARLKAIEDAIRAVSLLLDSSSSVLADGSGLLITPQRGLDITGGSLAAGISIASGGLRAVFPDTPSSAAAGRAVASVADDPPSPRRRLARRPPLKVSILTLLKERPTMWPLDSLVKAMREQRLVGGASEKTIKETVRQTANKMAAEGEIRRQGNEYGWPPDPSEGIGRFRSDVMGRLTKHLGAAADPLVTQHGS